SQARNLASGQSGTTLGDQVFLWNRLTGVVTLVSHNFASPMTMGNSFSDSPVLSADGHFIAYFSASSDLVQGLIEPGPSILVPNVYLYDTVAGTTTLMSHAAGDPKRSGDFSSLFPVLSDDGRFVAYQSLATTL